MNLWSNVFRHHRWSNQTLIKFLYRLPADQLELTVPGTYGSSIDTIRHLISSDGDYVRIIPDTPEVLKCEQNGPFSGWDELRAVAESAHTALVAYVDGLTDDMFFIDMDEEKGFTLAKSYRFAQIIHHTTEHRSQIRTTLSAHGIEAHGISVWAWRRSEEGRVILAGLATHR